MTTRSIANRGELFVSLGLIALGTYMLVDIHAVESTTQGYDQLGPKLFPMLIGIALIVFGATLGWQSASGGWRNMPADDEGRDKPDWIAFTVIAGGLLLHMAVIGAIGFVLASVLLFMLVARGFGSRQWRRDLISGICVALAAYYLFTAALGLHLTKSPFGVF